MKEDYPQPSETEILLGGIVRKLNRINIRLPHKHVRLVQSTDFLNGYLSDYSEKKDEYEESPFFNAGKDYASYYYEDIMRRFPGPVGMVTIHIFNEIATSYVEQENKNEEIKDLGGQLKRWLMKLLLRRDNQINQHKQDNKTKASGRREYEIKFAIDRMDQSGHDKDLRKIVEEIMQEHGITGEGGDLSTTNITHACNQYCVGLKIGILELINSVNENDEELFKEREPDLSSLVDFLKGDTL